MPFVSRAQEQWAFATHQPFARQWAAITDQRSLPARVAKPRKPHVLRDVYGHKNAK